MFTIARAYDCTGPTIGEWLELAHARDLDELRQRLADVPWRAGRWRITKNGRPVVSISLDDGASTDVPSGEFLERVCRLAA